MTDRDADGVVICPGRPRQEVWMRDHGNATNAGLLLRHRSFDVDFDVDARS